MAQLTAANEARLRKALDKLYRFNGVVQSLQQYLDGNQFTVVSKDSPKYEYNRHTFNRLDNNQQPAYEARMALRVMKHYALFTDGSMLELPKMVADYYRERA